MIPLSFSRNETHEYECHFLQEDGEERICHSPDVTCGRLPPSECPNLPPYRSFDCLRVDCDLISSPPNVTLPTPPDSTMPTSLMPTTPPNVTLPTPQDSTMSSSLMPTTPTTVTLPTPPDLTMPTSLMPTTNRSDFDMPNSTTSSYILPTTNRIETDLTTSSNDDPTSTFFDHELPNSTTTPYDLRLTTANLTDLDPDYAGNNRTDDATNVAKNGMDWYLLVGGTIFGIVCLVVVFFIYRRLCKKQQQQQQQQQLQLPYVGSPCEMRKRPKIAVRVTDGSARYSVNTPPPPQLGPPPKFDPLLMKI